jgi:hypothetical protein
VTVRDERAAALIRRHRDLSDDFTRALPGLLDDLEAIDAAHNLSEMPRTGAEAAEWARPAPTEGDAPTDDQIGEWIRTHEREFEAWVRKQNRINGAPPPFDAPVKPAPRRRTAK